MGKRNQHTFTKGHKFVGNRHHSEETKRKIRETPVVHHIDGNHFNDAPENRVILTRAEHATIHQLQGDVGFQKGNQYAKKKK